MIPNNLSEYTRYGIIQRCIKRNPDWFYAGENTQRSAHTVARCIADSVFDELKQVSSR